MSIDYEKEVRKIYPNAYQCYNTLFETHSIFEDHTFSNRLSEKTKLGYEAWQSAYETLKQQNKII